MLGYTESANITVHIGVQQIAPLWRIIYIEFNMMMYAMKTRNNMNKVLCVQCIRMMDTRQRQTVGKILIDTTVLAQTIASDPGANDLLTPIQTSKTVRKK